jgi:hypothetical protein
MNNMIRVIIVVVLVAATGIVVAIKQINKNKSAKEKAKKAIIRHNNSMQSGAFAEWL